MATAFVTVPTPSPALNIIPVSFKFVKLSSAKLGAILIISDIDLSESSI